MAEPFITSFYCAGMSGGLMWIENGSPIISLFTDAKKAATHNQFSSLLNAIFFCC
jgi:hypothetical protein